MIATISRAGLYKEFRALLAPWAVVLAGQLATSRLLDLFVVVVTFIGAVGLGAWSMGHEYSDRTLPLLLSQPRDRRSLWLEKVLVLGVLLAVIVVAALPLTARDTWVVVLTGAFTGLTLAPVLTMLARSARGGAIFTIAIVLFLFIGFMWLGETIATHYPDRWLDPHAFADRLVWWGFTGMCGLSAAIGWRAFQTLGAVDERTEHLTLPELGWSRTRVATSDARPHHPVLALVGKEMGLLIPVFVLSTVYVVAWIAGWILRPATRESLVMVATALHGGLVPLLAGAMASAEERRMGTLSPQLLQPVSTRVQWLIKAVVVIGMAVALAVGLPVLLQLVEAGSVLTDHGLRNLAFGSGLYRLQSMGALIVVIGMLAALSLYVSSLTRNSLHALLASIAAAMLLWSGLLYAQQLTLMAQRQVARQIPGDQLSQQLIEAQQELRQRANPRDTREYAELRAMSREVSRYWRDLARASDALMLATVLLVVTGTLWLLLRFGAENHRFADHRVGRVATQVTAVLLVPVVALAFCYGLPAWLLRG